MENRGIVTYIFLVICIVFVLFPSSRGLAYDNQTTHPALTQEIIKFFNYSYPQKEIKDSDTGSILKGSIEEDNFGRWLRHFYDPIYKKGLTYLGFTWQSSKDWAGDTLNQATYKFVDLPSRTLYGRIKDIFTGETDYSWDRAVYEYAWGDKKRGLEALGHILHLLEDASVPEHTRNDPHPGLAGILKGVLPNLAPDSLVSLLENSHNTKSSPYENFVTQFNTRNIDIASGLEQEQPILTNSFEQSLEQLATYSNNNFFSKDTISTNSYSNPNVSFIKEETLSDGKLYRFGYKKDEYGNNIRLVLLPIKDNWHLQDNFIRAQIDDIDHLILSDYWTHLSKQAVLYGAGAVKLFFDEVEKEKQTKALYNKNKSWLSLEIEKFGWGTFGVAGSLYGSSVTKSDLLDEGGSVVGSLAPADVFSPPKPTKVVQNQTEIFTPSEFISADKNSFPVSVKNSPAINPVSDIKTSPKTEDISPIIIPSLPSNISNIVPIAGAAGSLSSNQTPSDSATTSVTTPAPDTTAPDAAITANECEQSLASSGCLVASSTVNIVWSSTATDVDHYTVECTISSVTCSGFPNLSSATSTSVVYSLPTDNSTYTFKIIATDTSGNQSIQQTKDVKYISRPMVINEIAWGGTSAAHPTDQWIEIYNTTSDALNLSGFNLASSANGGVYINLSGNLGPKSYYVITNHSNTFSDITASSTVSFGNNLLASGEVLTLSKASTTIDKTPTVASCGGWCGGSNSTYYTMERYDFWASGEDLTNWSNFQSFLSNGKSADNVNINGTPGRRNSGNYLIALTGNLNADKTLTKVNSPYVVSSTNFQVNNGKTLTIEPGVVIKFLASNTSLLINGVLNAQGTTADPIIFTSLKDDTYSGDTNNDSSTSTPAAGDWGTVKLAGNGSILDHVIMRYGGQNDGIADNFKANLRIDNVSSFTLTNSTIEETGIYGVRLLGSSGTISNNIIRNNNHNSGGAGIWAGDGTLTISNNTIQNNSYGIRLYTVGGTNNISINNNTFNQNTNSAMDAVTIFPTISGNTATNNGFNGFNLQGVVNQNLILSSDPGLPYIIFTNLTIPSGKNLTIPAGTILKFNSGGSIVANGKLTANGTTNSKTIFTSIKDDTYGGDTNNDNAASTPAAGDWLNLNFNSTAASSTLDNVVVRYGGNTNVQGAVTLNNVSIGISNSIFENNYNYGIRMNTSTSTSITNSIFQNHQTPTNSSYGIFLMSATPSISNTTFNNNYTAIWGDAVLSVTDGGGNIFTNNTVNTNPANLLH